MRKVRASILFFFAFSREKPGVEEKMGASEGSRANARRWKRRGASGIRCSDIGRVDFARVWSALCGLEGRFRAHDLFSISLRSSNLGLTRGDVGG